MGINFAAILMAVAVAAAAVAGSAAQSTPACASKLLGCQAYINTTTTPPDSCCGPLKEAAKDDLRCLCALLNNTAVLNAFGVNVTQAVQVAGRCGAATDEKACATLTATPGAAPPSSTNNTGTGNSSAHGLTSIGLPGLVSLLFCWWFLMA